MRNKQIKYRLTDTKLALVYFLLILFWHIFTQLTSHPYTYLQDILCISLSQTHTHTHTNTHETLLLLHPYWTHDLHISRHVILHHIIIPHHIISYITSYHTSHHIIYHIISHYIISYISVYIFLRQGRVLFLNQAP